MARLGLVLALLAMILALCLPASAQTCENLEFINGTRCTFCTNPADNRCLGCDARLPEGQDLPAIYDLCKVCNGEGATCLGCDGVAGSGRNYDECGTCGGNGASCSDAARTMDVVFDPPDTTAAQRIYKLPLVVKFSSPTEGATVRFVFQFLDDEGNEGLAPPNMLSEAATTITVTRNITIKAFAFKNGLRQSAVVTALYRVSETGSDLGGGGLLIPIYAVIAIAVGGVVLVVVIAIIITVVRVRNRTKLVEIRLDASEAIAKDDTYRAIYDYAPQNGDELELRVGDIVHVNQKHDDGWWDVVSYRLRGKSGVVPGNYFELVPAERLMWVERPKTVFGRLSQRISNFFGGAPQYGMDPQTARQSRLSNRISNFFGAKPQQSYNMPAKPTGVPPRPTGGLPPRPNEAVPSAPRQNRGYY